MNARNQFPSLCLRLFISVLFGVSVLGIPARAEHWRQFDYGGRIKCMSAGENSVWIGGEKGALRYDVDRELFLRVEKVVNEEDKSIQLAGEIVRDIAVDRRGRVWFACWDKTRGLEGKGITVMNEVRFASFSQGTCELPSDEVYTLCADPQGRVWAGTEKGVAIFDEGQWTTYTTDDGIAQNDAREIAVGPYGRVWCGFWRGVNVYYDDQWWSWERKDSNLFKRVLQGRNSHEDYIYSIVHGKDNRVYCSTKGGISIYDGERWTFERAPIKKYIISSMAIDEEGKLWSSWGGQDQGVSIFNGSKWTKVTQRNTKKGLVSNRAIAVASDRYNRIWIGDRDGRISVRIPDGAPDVVDRALEGWESNSTLRGYPAGSLENQFSTQIQIMEDEWEYSSYDDIPSTQIIAALPEDAVKTDEAPHSSPPVLIAQAGTNPAVKITITVPEELESSIAGSPYEATQEYLDIEGVVTIAKDEIDKIEANGFEAKVPKPVDLGGTLIYTFKASVLVRDIDQIPIVLFDRNGNILGSKEYPVTLKEPEPESTKPDVYFLRPEVTEDQMLITRGQGIPIEIQLTSANRGLVRGLAQDDTGIKDVRLNNQTVEYMVPASPSHLEEAGLEKTGHDIYFDQRFTLQAGDNTILIQVVDYFNNITEIPFSLRVQQALSDSMFYGNNYAMIVGINDYQYWPKLNNAAHDAEGIQELLIEYYKFPKENVFSVFDNDANREGILDAFQKVSRAEKNSRVIIFFAGHGHSTSTRSGKKTGYIIPVDGALSASKTPSADERRTWLSMRDISDQIDEYFQAKHILLIFDSCYSGLLLVDRSGGFEEFGGDDAATADFLELADEFAVEVITAGEQDEKVLDGGPGGHSFFTGALIEALQKGAADTGPNDGVITSQELGAYLMNEIPQLTGGKQHPKYAKLPGFEEDEGLVLFAIGGEE